MKLGLTVMIGSLTLAGCSSSTLPCNDGNVKDTVFEIITSSIHKAQWAKEGEEQGLIGDYSVTGIKTLSYDEKIDYYTCAASFNFEHSGKPYNKDFTYELSYLEDSGETDIAVYGVNEIKSRILATIMTRGR